MMAAVAHWIYTHTHYSSSAYILHYTTEGQEEKTQVTLLVKYEHSNVGPRHRGARGENTGHTLLSMNTEIVDDISGKRTGGESISHFVHSLHRPWGGYIDWRWSVET